MKTTYYTISGTMLGELWWKGKATVDFSMDFVRDERLKISPWVKHFDTLREAVIDALCTGDFRGGIGEALSNCQLTVHRAGNHRKVVRSFPLSLFASVSDMIAKEDALYN